MAHVWRTDKGNLVTVGDIVVFQDEGEQGFGEVVLMYKADDQDFTIVFKWEPCAVQHHTYSIRLLARQNPVRIASAQLATSLIVSRWEPNVAAVALLPLQFR